MRPDPGVHQPRCSTTKPPTAEPSAMPTLKAAMLRGGGHVHGVRGVLLGLFTHQHLQAGHVAEGEGAHAAR